MGCPQVLLWAAHPLTHCWEGLPGESVPSLSGPAGCEAAPDPCGALPPLRITQEPCRGHQAHSPGALGFRDPAQVRHSPGVALTRRGQGLCEKEDQQERPQRHGGGASTRQGAALGHQPPGEEEEALSTRQVVAPGHQPPGLWFEPPALGALPQPSGESLCPWSGRSGAHCPGQGRGPCSML